MGDLQLLDNKIKGSGYKVGFLAETLGISRQAFRKKLKGTTPFRASEVYVLCDMLKIDATDRQKIFCPKG